jgi:thiamine-monophosphate kinase
LLSEFEQIAQIMAPLAADAEGAFALTDDAAVFSCPDGEEIVVTTDTLVADVHFFANDPADEVAHKLLGVNLSDLAGMGAKPLHYTLNTSYPANISIEWIRLFAEGLKTIQERYSIILLGGDTTHTPGPLTLSLTAFGTVPIGKALRRTTPKTGDLICVSGTIGDSALGLLVAQGKLTDKSGYLLKRYRQPQPRCLLGQALRDIATGCLDISDGLLADLGHMKKGAQILLPTIPLSSAAQEQVIKDSSLFETILSGGDDYELLFTVPHREEEQLHQISKQTNTNITVIGRITETSGIQCLDENNEIITFSSTGYLHF